jgi:hypothetical protein
MLAFVLELVIMPQHVGCPPRTAALIQEPGEGAVFPMRSDLERWGIA